MSDTVRIFNPTAPRRARTQHAGPPPIEMRGAVVGFIDNAKPNFDHLAEDLSGLLASRYGIARAIRRRKRVAGIPSPEAILGELTSQCSLVIVGSGD